jgi:hypothetical protein
MNDLHEQLKRQINAVMSAPIILGVIVMLTLATVWAAIHWSYNAVLSGKDARISSMERIITQYRDSVGGASPEEARRRIGVLESELSNLRIRLTPRRLTPKQSQAIADRSRRPSGTPTRSLTLFIQEACSDCASFARDIVAALHVADNWKVATKTVFDVGERTPSGLAIRVSELGRPPQEAVVLQEALRSAELPFRVLENGSGAEAELVISERFSG